MVCRPGGCLAATAMGVGRPGFAADKMNFNTSAGIHIREGLPPGMSPDAAELYLTALADKLVPVLGRGDRAVQALASGLNRKMCLAAHHGERLIGILGIQTTAAGFVDIQWDGLRSCYGYIGSLWRMALLVALHHKSMPGEAYIDGIAVVPDWRGRGIGSRLLAALEMWAADRELEMLCLEVIDTNPRAAKLYRSLGFETAGEQVVWPLGSLFSFQRSTVMVKLLV